MKARLSVLTVLFLVGAVLFAQSVDENSLFGGDSTGSDQAAPAASGSPAPQSSPSADNPDSFFEGSSPVVEGGTVKSTYDETFTKQQPIQIGGSFEFLLSTGVKYKKDPSDWDSDYFWRFDSTNENSALKLDGSMFFSARPSDALHVYGKMLMTYPFSLDAATLSSVNSLIAGGTTVADSGVPVPNLQIWELYTDFNIADKVFFRAGKQMVKWGVGYFFQPADIISLTPVDVTNPTADREGPVAVKANVPIGLDNLDFYLIAPANSAISSVKDLGLASRFQLVVGGWELSLGVGYQQNRDWQFVTTASGSVWNFDVFGEAKLNRKSLGNYFTDDPATIGGVVPVSHTLVNGRDTWFFSGTAGLSYSNTDAYLTLLGQYYFNGEGYDDVKDVTGDALKYVGAGKLGMPDLVAMNAGFTGKHYIAINAIETFADSSKVSLSTYWIANLSDGSGTVNPAFNINITDQIILTFNTSFAYGADGSQFRGLTVNIPNVDPSSFLLPRALFGVQLSLGTGNF